MSFDLSDAEKEAWRWINKNPMKGATADALAAALTKTLARALLNEFWRQHKVVNRIGRQKYCHACAGDVFSERHQWKNPDWHAEAERILRGL